MNTATATHNLSEVSRPKSAYSSASRMSEAKRARLEEI